MTDEEPRVPAGERLARMEGSVSDMREEVRDIKRTLDTLVAQQNERKGFAAFGRLSWGIIERLLLVLIGAGAVPWLQRHWPGGMGQ